MKTADYNNLTIEKGMTITDYTQYRSRVDFLKKMRKGDSVYFDMPNIDQIRNELFIPSKILNVKLAFRVDGDGYRMWRIA